MDPSGGPCPDVSLRRWHEAAPADRAVAGFDAVAATRAVRPFIATAEVAGALGLILPGLLRIRPILTLLAALGLVLDMIGATAYNLI
ncbi:MAG TPA: DoxX family protein, partial [Ktedonosporobacter sp.]|nr:DoxX family protein [Ktedonosporobacter sp.]